MLNDKQERFCKEYVIDLGLSEIAKNGCVTTLNFEQ